MKKLAAPARNITVGLFFGMLITGSLAFADRGEKKTVTPTEVVPVTVPPLPKELSFAGEAVPLDRWDVKERLDREVLINHSSKGNVIFLLKSANRYFPVIEARLKAAGVPDDFKYLCIAESNLVPSAISSVGAASFWQFMSGTAPGYGLEVNKEVDRRYDLVKATDAACAYLKSAYQKFGSWTAAAASYNCGQGGYNGQASYQGTTNYYDLLLPEETNRYIFRILTFKYLFENAESLGFQLAEGDKYAPIPVREVTVTSSLPNLAAYAKSQGTTYKMLRQLNPWLRGRSLTISGGKSYTLKLPAERSF
jgi:hypothetical protein